MLSKKIESKQVQTANALKEAQILSGLEHENIIKQVDVFLSQGKFYIVMEFAPNGDLEEHIQKYGHKKRKFKICIQNNPFALVLAIFIDFCLAIQAKRKWLYME